MRKHVLWVLVLALCGVAVAQGMKKGEHPMGSQKMGGQKMAMADHKIVQPNDIQWGDAPPVLPAGAKMAVMHGDPGKPGIFIIRLKAPDGYRIPPHWHPTAEHVTVISGNFSVGMGDKMDESSMTSLGPGGFVSLNAKSHHYGKTKGETVLQVGGMG
ncbi:MAG: cupin domain-containing protein, partial [Acidobacteriota bacterium]|nr:cupin domain-containing protein [Acidobacteriota bacterium]